MYASSQMCTRQEAIASGGNRIFGKANRTSLTLVEYVCPGRLQPQREVHALPAGIQ